MKKRPQTPLIALTKSKTEQISINEKTKDSYLKNFSYYMKQIIDKNNEAFLSGSKNLVRYILAQYLQVSEDELNNIQKLSILITHNYGLLNQFGIFLPNLILLKMNNSNILTFTDIGTNFTKIQCLQLQNCHLKDLNGIVCMQQLQILDIENNLISDLTDIDMCSELTKINLKNNKIQDFDNIIFLSSVDNLSYVCIIDNPICNEEDFEEKAKVRLSQVKKLIINKEKDEKNIEDIVEIFNLENEELNSYTSNNINNNQKDSNKDKKEEIIKGIERKENKEEEKSPNKEEKTVEFIQMSSRGFKNNNVIKSKIQIDASSEIKTLNHTSQYFNDNIDKSNGSNINQKYQDDKNALGRSIEGRKTGKLEPIVLLSKEKNKDNQEKDKNTQLGKIQSSNNSNLTNDTFRKGTSNSKPLFSREIGGSKLVIKKAKVTLLGTQKK